VTDAHRIELTESPAHVRVLVHGEVVADTDHAKLLQEGALLPRWYIPREDVRADVLEDSDHASHCPFKGDASYHSVRVGDHLDENLVWFYPEPIEAVAGIRDHLAFYGENENVEIQVGKGS
jgi:uncharacterized protein (DUF427 family)